MKNEGAREKGGKEKGENCIKDKNDTHYNNSFLSYNYIPLH